MRVLNFLFYTTFIDFQNIKYGLDFNSKNSNSSDIIFNIEPVDHILSVIDYKYELNSRYKDRTSHVLKKDFNYNFYYKQFNVIQLNNMSKKELRCCNIFYNLLKKEGKLYIKDDSSIYKNLEKNKSNQELSLFYKKFQDYFRLIDKKMINGTHILIYKKKTISNKI
jgi:ribonuclease BN (tRNA processing enzyme)